MYSMRNESVIVACHSSLVTGPFDIACAAEAAAVVVAVVVVAAPDAAS